MPGPPARQIPPNTQFNNYKIIHELTKAEIPYGRARWFYCECDCGTRRLVRIDRLGMTNACIECSKKYDHLYKQAPGCPRNIQDSHAWECWRNILQMEVERSIPVCDEWRDFETFLLFYMENTGLLIEDILRGRYERSFFHAERINKEIGWQPDNTTFIHFVTERARDKLTYEYWYKLKTKGLLDAELMSYKNFITIFGLKDGTRILRRRDITLQHSKQNSYWYIRDA